MSEKLLRREVLRILRNSAAALGGGALLGACDTIPGMPAPHTSEKRNQPEKYPLHKAVATIFYVGEEAGKDNAHIDNISTEWDTDSRRRFGGVDNPEKRSRDGMLPRGFTPKHNPFYFALPASEFTSKGRIPGAWERSPWLHELEEAQAKGQPFPDDGSRSLFKGRWIEVTNPANGNVSHGQWLDTGPGTDPDANRDYDYVFSTKPPAKPFGELHASLDLSPAMAHQLGFGLEEGGASVTWRFVDEPPAIVSGYLHSKGIEPIDNLTHYS